MRRTLIAAGLAAGISALGLGAASAQTFAIDDGYSVQPQQARVVCNEWGRCWNTGPRYGYRYAPRHRYGYYDAPRYRGYYGDYGPYYREPGLSFRFGF